MKNVFCLFTVTIAATILLTPSISFASEKILADAASFEPSVDGEPAYVNLSGPAAQAMFDALAPEAGQLVDGGTNKKLPIWSKVGESLTCQKDLTTGKAKYSCAFSLSLDDSFTKLTGAAFPR